MAIDRPRARARPRLRAVVAIVAGAAGVAAQAAAAPREEEPLAAFARRKPADQERIVALIRAGAEAYALREQAQMVLAVEGFDVRGVVDLVVASAPPLPQPLWSAPYEPLAAWHRVFDARIDAMTGASGDTDAFLVAARERLAAHAERVAGIARAALAPAATSH